AGAADAVPGQAPLRADPADAWADLPGSRAVPSRPSSTVTTTMPRRARIMPIGALTRRVRRLSSGFSRLLRLAMAAATMGAVAVFAYQGGERLAASVGPTTPAVHPAAALAAPEVERPAPAVARNLPPQVR